LIARVRDDGVDSVGVTRCVTNQRSQIDRDRRFRDASAIGLQGDSIANPSAIGLRNNSIAIRLASLIELDRRASFLGGLSIARSSRPIVAIDISTVFSLIFKMLDLLDVAGSFKKSLKEARLISCNLSV
jgi:hypothetical protein